MNSLLILFSSLAYPLLFQKLSTDDGIPYEPNDGPDWILILVAVVVLAALVFVLLKVFKGLQRSRESEGSREVKDSARAPKK